MLSVASLESFDCRLFTANGANAYNVSGPLICNVLSSCEKLIPDILTNFVDGVHVTAFTISNAQITYQLINFGQDVQNMVLLMPKFIIKSEGWSNSAMTVSLGTVV